VTLLAWRRAGDQEATDRPAVVLIHPWAGSGADWERAGWTAGLVEAGLDVWVPDLPGHGESADVRIPKAAVGVSWSATAVLADLDKLGVRRFAVAAYADACPVAAHLAVRAPERTTGLVLVGCDDRVAFPYGKEAAGALRNQRMRVWQPEVAALLRRARANRNADPDVLAAWLEEAPWPAAARLGALRTPTLLAVGTEDGARARVPRLAQLFFDAHLATVTGDAETVLESEVLIQTVADFLTPAVDRR